jgi:hypothetical protein
MTISTFDRATCRVVAQEIEAAVKAIAAKHGVSIKVARSTFSNGPTMDVKLACAVIASDGVVVDKDASALDQLGGLLGLVDGARGKTFTYGRKPYKLVGYRNSGGRMPFIGECDGKRYKFAIEALGELRARV